MQRQTIKEWVRQLKTEPGLKAEDYRIYLIRDPAPVDACFEGGTVFYVGQSVDPSYRLWEHFGGSSRGPSLIGTFICENAPESGPGSSRSIP